MGDKLVEDKELELLPCRFEFHDFVAEAGEVSIKCHITKMKDSLYIWIGDSNDGKMSDLSVAMISKYEKQPISTKIMGTNEDSTSTSLAKRLAKKCGRPVFVSFNITVNNLILQSIEKAIQTEFNEHKEFFNL